MIHPVVVLVEAGSGWCGGCYQSLVMVNLRSEQDRCNGGCDCDHLIRILTVNLTLHYQRR